MGVRKRLEKIVLGAGLLALTQLAVANELAKEVNYFEKESSELSHLEVESFYDVFNGNNLSPTFLKKERKKNIFKNSDIEFKSRFVYDLGDREGFFKEGFGFDRQGANIVRDQKLRWLVQYVGKLPWNASFGYFKGENNGYSELGDIKYREISIRMPINGEDSPFSFGYGRAKVSIEKKKLYDGNIFRLDFKFNF